MKRKKLFGVFMESELMDYVTLLAEANGVTKSAILRKALNSYFSEQQKDFPVETLIKNIAFKFLIKKNTKEKIVERLMSKGINTNYISLILQQIKELNEKNEFINTGRE